MKRILIDNKAYLVTNMDAEYLECMERNRVNGLQDADKLIKHRCEHIKANNEKGLEIEAKYATYDPEPDKISPAKNNQLHVEYLLANMGSLTVNQLRDIINKAVETLKSIKV